LRLLCNKAIWLQSRTLMACGDFEEVIVIYRRAQANPDPRELAARSDVAVRVVAQV
jgi:ABC-type polysaccharide/polyol phosphate transport system ATPase subunit